MALKDASGLVKKYAMVNVHNYQIVATGDTVNDCEASYRSLIQSNGIGPDEKTGETSQKTQPERLKRLHRQSLMELLIITSF